VGRLVEEKARELEMEIQFLRESLRKRLRGGGRGA